MFRVCKALVGALLLSVIVGGVGVGANARSFRGTGGGAVTEQQILAPDDVLLTAVGGGHSSRLGSFTRLETLHLNPGTGVFTGSITFVMANGDLLTTTVDGQFVSGAEACGTYTITGGTGRFSTATGQASFSVQSTGPTTFVFVFHGELHK